MDQNNSEIRAKDKDEENNPHAVSPIGSLEKSSEIFGNNFGTFEESYSFDSDESDFEAEYTCKLCDTYFSGIKPLRQHEKSRKHLKNLNKIKLQKDIDGQKDNPNGSFFEDKTYTVCNDCKKEFTGIEPYQQHLKSKAHQKKVAFKKLKDQAKEDGKINLEKLKHLIEQEGAKTSRLQASALDSDEDDINMDDLKCTDCEKVFTGLESFYEHMKSKMHKKILKQKELISKLITGTTSGNTSGIEINEEDIVCKLCHLSFTGPENVTAHLQSRGHAKMQETRLWKKMQKEKKVLEESQTVSELGSKVEDVNGIAQTPFEPKEDLESKENTFQCYSRYKEYKEIMRDAQSNQKE